MLCPVFPEINGEKLNKKTTTIDVHLQISLLVHDLRYRDERES